jgi:hypothetical protein
MGVALGKVVSHDDEAISSTRDGVFDANHDHAQERPTEVKMPSMHLKATISVGWAW